MVKFTATVALLSAVLLGLLAADVAAQAPPASQPPQQPPALRPLPQQPPAQQPGQVPRPPPANPAPGNPNAPPPMTAADMIAKARNGTMIPNTPIECQVAAYNSRTLQPCNPSPINRHALPPVETACDGAPRDGKPGHYCSDSLYTETLKDIQAKCTEQLKDSRHPINKVYGLFYLLPLNAGIRCLKQQPSGEWCSKRAVKNDTADADADAPPTCDDCDRQRLQMTLDWKRPEGVAEPAGNPTTDMILNPSEDELDICNIKPAGSTGDQQEAGESAATPGILQQATGAATTAAIISASLMFGLISLV